MEVTDCTPETACPTADDPAAPPPADPPVAACVPAETACVTTDERPADGPLCAAAVVPEPEPDAADAEPAVKIDRITAMPKAATTTPVA